MKWVIHANNIQQLEFSKALTDDTHIQWITEPTKFNDFPGSELYIDLLFENSPQRIKLLRSINSPLLINSVPFTLKELDLSCIRFNGWPGLMENTIEASGDPAQLPDSFLKIIKPRIHWLPDSPGFISARVLAMIINEAYLALEEAISSKSDIDTAMRLGTNYPMGPFEWSEKIGLKNIFHLLSTLSIVHMKYTPSNLLAKEATR